MGTDFEEIYSLAIIEIQDYKLNNLYKIDKDAFLERMRSFLVRAIPRFNGCLKELSYNHETITIETSENTTSEKVNWFFNEELNQQEKSILAGLLVGEWWQGQINDVTSFQPHLTNKTYKQLQESQSLKQKSIHYDKYFEYVQKEINDYKFNNLDKLKFFGGGK